MVGLILFLLQALQEPVAEPQGSEASGQQQRMEAALTRLRALLAAPAEADAGWRRRLFIELTRLEHGPQDSVLPAWELLGNSGQDRDLSNLILYRRRQALPLPAVGTGEGSECALERGLALWGEGRLPEARAALVESVRRYPEDPRFLENLLWLDLEFPKPFRLNADARATTLAVLSARRAKQTSESR